jgi:hypothetical protein
VGLSPILLASSVLKIYSLLKHRLNPFRSQGVHPSIHQWTRFTPSNRPPARFHTSILSELQPYLKFSFTNSQKSVYYKYELLLAKVEQIDRFLFRRIYDEKPSLCCQLQKV